MLYDYSYTTTPSHQYRDYPPSNSNLAIAISIEYTIQ